VRDGDTLFLHGSPQSRLLGIGGEGLPLCFTVTLIDGLVLARSGFNHSINYRSAVVLGRGREVTDDQEKFDSLTLLVDHIVPGRSNDARGPTAGELRATKVVAMSIEEASAKLRSGPPGDNKRDLDLPIWAGVVPVALRAGEPVPDAHCGVPAPDYVLTHLTER
jgi:nitroimidazol reductase NimA-like FMN-containing flavoprotein (pyridoxamine 5'-phosphate oxidase superfamily)